MNGKVNSWPLSSDAEAMKQNKISCEALQNHSRDPQTDQPADPGIQPDCPDRDSTRN
ncbi:MAG: hypothetical protein ACLSDJ_02695 [Butyricimonas faecihominis]